MPEWKLKTPVAFIIFNRPDTSKRVFAEIAKARPPKLLVVGDGPRTTRQGEVERVVLTRSIIEKVDWPCEVLTNFSDKNMGCKNRLSSGLDWVFQQVEEAIILEDDCLPSPTFFRFCQEMLERYRHDERIAMISGDNFLFGKIKLSDSYYFSQYMHIWGWASWRRAWKDYDVGIKAWPRLRDERFVQSKFSSKEEQCYWLNVLNRVHAGKIDTWDYQWIFSSWLQSRISIMPATNLISNIGFGPEATHTTGSSKLGNMPVGEILFPLRHPSNVCINASADTLIAREQFTMPARQYLFNRAKEFFKAVFAHEA